MTGDNESGQPAPKAGETGTEVADALVAMVHGARDLRKAVVGETIGAAKKVVSGIDKILDSLQDEL